MATNTSPTPRRPPLGRHRIPSRRRILVTVVEGVALAVLHLPLLVHVGVLVLVYVGRRLSGHHSRPR